MFVIHAVSPNEESYEDRTAIMTEKRNDERKEELGYDGFSQNYILITGESWKTPKNRDNIHKP